ncbi:hypothetical protein KC842_00640 [Candidatus Nomurabacteria bacterium]|nr:hypothetical protein [Candidatus Nomurabacteria bacterium]
MNDGIETTISIKSLIEKTKTEDLIEALKQVIEKIENLTNNPSAGTPLEKQQEDQKLSSSLEEIRLEVKNLFLSSISEGIAEKIVRTPYPKDMFGFQNGLCAAYINLQTILNGCYLKNGQVGKEGLKNLKTCLSSFRQTLITMDKKEVINLLEEQLSRQGPA